MRPVPTRRHRTWPGSSWSPSARHPQVRFQVCYQEGKRYRSAGIFLTERRALAEKRALERRQREQASAPADLNLERYEPACGSVPWQGRAGPPRPEYGGLHFHDSSQGFTLSVSLPVGEDGLAPLQCRQTPVTGSKWP
jgi:hypothetical protein